MKHNYDRFLEPDKRLKLRDKAAQRFFETQNHSDGHTYAIRELEVRIHSQNPPALTPDIYTMLIDYFNNEDINDN